MDFLSKETVPPVVFILSSPIVKRPSVNANDVFVTSVFFEAEIPKGALVTPAGQALARDWRVSAAHIEESSPLCNALVVIERYSL